MMTSKMYWTSVNAVTTSNSKGETSTFACGGNRGCSRDVRSDQIENRHSCRACNTDDRNCVLVVRMSLENNYIIVLTVGIAHFLEIVIG